MPRFILFSLAAALVAVVSYNVGSRAGQTHCPEYARAEQDRQASMNKLLEQVTLDAANDDLAWCRKIESIVLDRYESDTFLEQQDIDDAQPDR